MRVYRCALHENNLWDEELLIYCLRRWSYYMEMPKLIRIGFYFQEFCTRLTIWIYKTLAAQSIASLLPYGSHILGTKNGKNSSPQFEPSLTESEHLQPLTCVIFNPELVLITCPGPRVSCISIWVEDDQHLIPVARPGFTQIKLAGERAISLARPSERRSQFCVFWLNGNFFFLRRVCLLVKDSPKGSI